MNRRRFFILPPEKSRMLHTGRVAVQQHGICPKGNHFDAATSPQRDKTERELAHRVDSGVAAAYDARRHISQAFQSISGIRALDH